MKMVARGCRKFVNRADEWRDVVGSLTVHNVLDYNEA